MIDARQRVPESWKTMQKSVACSRQGSGGMDQLTVRCTTCCGGREGEIVENVEGRAMTVELTDEKDNFNKL